MKNKVAFITMDVESFYDSFCMQKKKIEPEKEFDCASNISSFLSYLNEENIKATLFLNLGFLPECLNEVLEAIDNKHEIALHSLIHADLSATKGEHFLHMLEESKKMIRNFLHVRVDGFRFPGFKYEKEQIEILVESNFKYDSSYINRRNLKGYRKVKDYVYEKDGFYEFALSTQRVFLRNINMSDGGFLRLYPWKFIEKRLKKLFHNSDSYVLYVHPFELFTGDFPKYKKLNVFERLYINRNRKEWFSRIKRIIEMLKEEGYTFMSMSDFIKEEGLKNG